MRVSEPKILPFDWQDRSISIISERRGAARRDTAEDMPGQTPAGVTSAYLDERFDREIMTELGVSWACSARPSIRIWRRGLGYVSTAS